MDRFASHGLEIVAQPRGFGDRKRRMVEVFREHASAELDAVLADLREARIRESGEIVSLPHAWSLDRPKRAERE